MSSNREKDPNLAPDHNPRFRENTEKQTCPKFLNFMVECQDKFLRSIAHSDKKDDNLKPYLDFITNSQKSYFGSRHKPATKKDLNDDANSCEAVFHFELEDRSLEKQEYVMTVESKTSS